MVKYHPAVAGQNSKNKNDTCYFEKSLHFGTTRNLTPNEKISHFARNDKL